MKRLSQHRGAAGHDGSDGLEDASAPLPTNAATTTAVVDSRADIMLLNGNGGATDRERSLAPAMHPCSRCARESRPGDSRAPEEESGMADTAAGVLIDTIHDWGVDVIFGLPGGGINGIMEALRTRQDKVRASWCKR
jgi:hypothetical protein